MLKKKIILYEYEDVLMGKRKGFTVAFTDSVESNRKAAGIIWRYAIENLLGWTVDQALIYLNHDLVKALKLDKTYCEIGYEYNTKKFFDYRYILQYAFPEKINYDVEEDARSEYERINRTGKYEHEKGPQKFHKNYFVGPEGVIRAAVVLDCAIKGYLSHLDVYELYRFFGAKKTANEWLKKRNLEVNVKSLYKTPLEYLHYSLPENSQNNIYYINEYLKDTYLKK